MADDYTQNFQPVGVPAAGDDDNAALSNLPGMSEYYQMQLDQDTQKLTDLPAQYKPQQFDQQAPQRDVQGVMSVAPLLIGLTALGGKFAKMNGRTMLAATNGMTKGLMQGNEQAYQDSRKRYDDAYQKWLDKFTQQNKLYDEMRNVYKGRIDADLRALEFARKATGDDHKVDMDSFKNWLQEKQYGLKLSQLSETTRHDKASEVIATERNNRAQNVTNAKTAANQKALADVGTEIDDLVSKIQVDPYAVGGAGYLARGWETAKTATGVGDQTAPAHVIQTAMSALLLKVPKLLTGSSKSAKDERERVNQIADAMRLGVTGPIAVQKLQELKSILNAAAQSQAEEPDDHGYVVGKTYTDAQGRKATYSGNGQWQALTTP